MLSNIHFSKDFYAELEAFARAKNTFIITDENVASLYEIENGKNIFVVEPGEKSKCMKTVLEIAEKMLAAKIDRSGKIVAVGGGVVGDMAGFVASIYMRGIKWINVPTTLLAEVDSSIGGKTAVDLGGFKNILGTFHAPTDIYISTHFLKTLPLREWQCGLGEVIKTAVLNKSLFLKAEKLAISMCAKNIEGLEDFFREVAEFKNKIVNKDFNEKGLRKILNVGHTLGHALEKCGNAVLSHGEYVLWGMLGEMAICKNIIDKDFYARVVALIKTVLEGNKIAFDTKAVTSAALLDKKNKSDFVSPISIICPINLGKQTETMLTNEYFERELNEWKEELKKAEMLLVL